MSRLYLAANQVSGTSFGHMQLVLDADGVFNNGDERELEVQSPNIFASGNWDVRPEQAFQIPAGAGSGVQELTLGTTRTADEVWEVLVNTRDHIATKPIDYRLGLIGALEGQNSNTYVITLAHVAGLDISQAVSGLLALPEFAAFPGAARNVVFDHHASDDKRLPPVAIDIAGSDGDDILNGGDSADTFHAGNGNDVVRGFDGDDTLNGEAGRDKLTGDSGDDILTGGAGRDRLRGDAGQDHLSGDAGRDVIRAGADDDTLSGGNGNDTLRGQNGKDVITGGSGNDNLLGGGGRDVFVFDGLTDEGADTVTGFQDGKDTFRVSGLAMDDISIIGGADALIVLGGLTEITLTGTAASLVTSDDFVLV